MVKDAQQVITRTSNTQAEAISKPIAHHATPSSSRIPNFAQMNSKARAQAMISRNILSNEEAHNLNNSGALNIEQAEKFIENCIGGYTLPLGIATNFLIDGEEVFIPMAVEESSVVAAASYGAKLARTGGGFISEPTETIATCQIQFYTSPSENIFDIFNATAKEKIFEIAQICHPRLISRGGGVKSIELRALSKPGYFVIHVNVDTCEAMGANIVNTIAEEVGRALPEIIPCIVGPKILTNLTTHRITKVKCEIEFSALERDGYSGEEAARRICSVWEFADLDPFRATTHNKGVMNGIDPIVIATGNDWRAVEAGCHAFASLTGVYKPLTKWFINESNRLQGEIAVPIAVGTVGGVTKLHPSATACLKLMGSPSSAKLSAIIASVGLAQNLSAIRALGCEGIQKGHMALHEKNLEMMRKYDHFPSISVVETDNTHK
ncbi:hydroxymethylglutaryl-CoA reductase, degradative [Fluviispira multicolorata]|uniref:3-hydroxy-3-methylglutaryl coenzyme A reductase n=1 Tax=Fluviispira multicolorata TaxID=2654512 RepID=A0A833JFU5_9BACT|nr:hydroxymethylglutaryl-CoA reductase, degradative [Fluviispira multicolorata]KAB8031816.1 hydroxymethylglutaryl-CoA reductase, degradative [Fluviispira multicolorata]